jgi:indolepyruvate ferredoxin oxidoreductase
MAAHLEGKGFATMNQTGLAQKFGAVVSHIKIAPQQSDIHAVRVSDKKADLLIGCDWLVASAGDTLAKVNPDETRLVLNQAEAPTSEFIHNPDLHFPADSLSNRIDQYFSESNRVTCDATTIARELLGDTIGANLFLVGVAYQQGLLPVSANAINKAIELNAVSVELNQSAFELGRRFVNQPDTVVAQLNTPSDTGVQTLDELISDHYERLVNYDSKSYAEQYLTLINRVTQADPRSGEDQSASRIAATQLYRLMAIKDEYEVARLLTSESFTSRISEQFGQSWRINYHLAPPVMSRLLNRGSQFRKLRFGAWLKWPLRVLAASRRVRGSFFDVFAYGDDRREEYRDLERFKADIDLVVSSLESTHYESAVALLESASTLKGFGHIRSANREEWLVSREHYRQALLLIADDAREASTT